jgi:dimethylhistidine N-methyltransferase
VATENPFLADVLAGLNSAQKWLRSQYFYDARGSELFEAITALPEYYLTRAETRLLRNVAPAIADQIAGGGTFEHRVLVEYGSGSSTKTPLLLNALKPSAYMPIDVSQSALDGAAHALQADYPAMRITPILADFTQAIPIPNDLKGPELTGFFPGSTIGNFDPETASLLLAQIAASQGSGSSLVLGIDQCSDVNQLIPAYNDAAGVTADFNLNLLVRINRELGGNIAVDNFAHQAIWNKQNQRIEMHLVAREDCHFVIADQEFSMRAGETIHTENSHKYRPDTMEAILMASGWSITKQWTDAKTGFAIYLAHAPLPGSKMIPSEIDRNTF